MPPKDRDIYDIYLEADRRKQEEILNRVSPQNREQFLDTIEERRVRSGADSAREVNSSTKPTTPTQSSAENIIGGAIGQAGANAAVDAVTGAAASSAPAAPTIVGISPSVGAPAAPVGSSFAATAAPAAAVVHGAATAAKFAQGGKLSDVEKAAYALPTAGLSLFSDSLQKKFKIGQPSGDEIMQDRINSLLENDIALPEFAQRGPSEYGLSKEQLVDRESAQLEDGEWGNATFAETRNEADLEPEDVWGGLPMFEMYGDDWLGDMTAKQRWEASQALLDNGLIREDRGQLWIDDPEAARAIADAAINGEGELSKTYEEGWYYNNKAPQPQEQAEPGQQVQVQAETRRPQRRPNRRPKPDIPEPELIEPTPVQPPPLTPNDYAQAYVDVFNTNQGLPANPMLSGRY